MITVFALMGSVDYEGDTLLGVYTSEITAKRERSTFILGNGSYSYDSYIIEECYVDAKASDDIRGKIEKRRVDEMKHIRFKYRDEMSRGKWTEQECIVSSVDECKRIYGLGEDCEYEILSVEEVD